MPETKILEKKIGTEVNQTPVVSVIIPAYNVADFIIETLDSIFAQTYKNYEIVLVNDGSPDTEELEKALAPCSNKIIYIKQENLGTAAARNTAIENSAGEFLAFLDGDDIWLPQYLESQLDELIKQGADLICADGEFFGGSWMRNISSLNRKSPTDVADTVNMISGKFTVITSGILALRETIVQAGMFDEELPRIGIEDFDLWFRIAKSGKKIDCQRKILLKYRVRMDSLSGELIQRINREIAAYDTIDRKYKLNAREKEALFERRKQCAAMTELERGKRSIAGRDFQSARKHILTANIYYRKLKLTVVTRLLQISPQMVHTLFRTIRPAEFSFISPHKKVEADD